ncbi:MAG TPA: hypothetical protein VMS79_05175 [Methanomassiliicoccales archaeon]|jgi:hypothetical protein|nr:hypothetical protein [Methanomassiliicoccales archaeon]
MSCYLHNLDEVLRDAGLQVNDKNRKKIDEVIHRVAGVEYKSCPSAWKKVKEMMAEDREGLVEKIREEFAKA